MSNLITCDLLKIFKTSVSAVLPGVLVRKCLNYCELTQEITVAGKKFDLKNKNIYVVGAGKAVQHMALEVNNILGSKIKSGIISIPVGSLIQNVTNNNLKFYEGAKNNLPDKDAVVAASNIEKLVRSLDVDDFLLVLISGGGSALLSLPKPPITLEEKIDLIKRLANSGADIKELNTVRKRLSDLKGGQLAIKAYPAQTVSLILSDIVGDPLHLIASGPTTEDKDDPSEAMTVINKYQIQNYIPKSIKNILNKQPDYSNKFPKDNVYNFLIGCNKLSTEAAYNKALHLKYNSLILSNIITGNVKTVSKNYVKLIKQFCDYLQGNVNLADLKSCLIIGEIPGIDYNTLNNLDKTMTTNENLCLILGGETTVEVKGSGKGGRNQQLALEISNLLHIMKEELKHFNVYILAAGTDGIDGPTDSAGAIGYINLISDAEHDGINVDSYLQNNDSYNFYKRFRNGELHVMTGHTNTNVMDIHLIIIQKKL